MKIVLNIIGVLMVLFGCIWFLQGINVLPGSFMTGQRMWLFIGIIVGIVGLALAYNGIRRPAGS